MRITAIVRGRVQGVGFRYFVRDHARGSGVSGFVRNEPDGSVTVVAEGTRAVLDEFVRRIRADGDPVIRVESIEERESEATGEFTGFYIQR